MNIYYISINYEYFQPFLYINDAKKVKYVKKSLEQFSYLAK